MVKTLSGANVTNIAGTLQDPDVLVEMTGISKQWSTKTRTSYETRIVDISPIVQSVNPLGGIAVQSDFDITIQQETISQFIQDLNADNETVDVYLQYGADAKIKIITGKLDRWEFSAGLLILHCIANTELDDKILPLEQINDDLGFLNIPVHNIGKWTPLTIGTHDRAFGFLVDHTPGSEKVKFNAAIAGHDAVDGVNSLSVYFNSAKEFIEVVSTVTDNTDGTVRFVGSAGFAELILRTIPIGGSQRGTHSGATINFDNTIDEDFATFGEWRAITPFGSSRTAFLAGRLREFPFPESVVVRNDELYLLIDMDRTDTADDITPRPINSGAQTLEVCEAGIELSDGTFPATAAQVTTVLADTESAFDNINELDDAETDLVFDTSAYAEDIGLDLDGDGTPETLPVARLSGRNLILKYTEEWTNPGGGPTASLKIQEMRLRIDMNAPVQTQQYYADVESYNDDGSGTYTGSASVVIENPADVVWFILDQLLGVGVITTASFTAARTALGNLALAGQLFNRTNARALLDDICNQSRLKLFLDLDDSWKVKAFTIPGASDRELKQASGDFITEDGTEGEIVSVTQTSMDELYNQFEILYAWNEATKSFEKKLLLDESTVGNIGEVLTESQARYGITRKLTVNAGWLRTDDAALSHGTYLIQQHAERKRIVTWRTAYNAADLEIGDMIALTHTDMKVVEDTTVFSGYRDTNLTTIQSGFTDPDTAAVIKSGAKVQLFEGRHRYEVFEVETVPMEGAILFTGRQADISFGSLSDPLVA